MPCLFSQLDWKFTIMVQINRKVKSAESVYHWIYFFAISSQFNNFVFFSYLLYWKSMYGMTSSGGYVTQYSRALERDVTRNKASVGDYYARKAEMLKILMTDNDSGESCTRGNSEILSFCPISCWYQLIIFGSEYLREIFLTFFGFHFAKLCFIESENTVNRINTF